MPEDSTEESVRRIGDRDEIIQLVWGYGATIDSGDKEGWMDLFVEDASLSFKSGAARGQGRAEIEAILVQALKAAENGPLTHTASNVVVDFDGQDAAHGRTTCVGYITTADGQIMARGGHYDDRFVRTANGWRFADRAHFVDWEYLSA